MDQPEPTLAARARRLALSIAMPALDSHAFKLSLSTAPGAGSWSGLRAPTIQTALAGVVAGLDALRSAGAFDGSAEPTADLSWGVVELAGGADLPVGAGRARIDFMPTVVRIDPWDNDHIEAPPPRDPRFANHCLALATTTIFRRAGAARLAKNAARALLTDWVDKQLPFAAGGQGPLAGLASLAEREILGAQAARGTPRKRPHAL